MCDLRFKTALNKKKKIIVIASMGTSLSHFTLSYKVFRFALPIEMPMKLQFRPPHTDGATAR